MCPHERTHAFSVFKQTDAQRSAGRLLCSSFFVFSVFILNFPLIGANFCVFLLFKPRGAFEQAHQGRTLPMLINLCFSTRHLKGAFCLTSYLSLLSFTSSCLCSSLCSPIPSPSTMHSITVQPPLICSLAEVLLITVHASVLLSSGATTVQEPRVLYKHERQRTAVAQTRRPSRLFFASISRRFQRSGEIPSLCSPHLP